MRNRIRHRISLYIWEAEDEVGNLKVQAAPDHPDAQQEGADPTTPEGVLLMLLPPHAFTANLAKGDMASRLWTSCLPIG